MSRYLILKYIQTKCNRDLQQSPPNTTTNTTTKRYISLPFFSTQKHQHTLAHPFFLHHTVVTPFFLPFSIHTHTPTHHHQQQAPPPPTCTYQNPTLTSLFLLLSFTSKQQTPIQNLHQENLSFFFPFLSFSHFTFPQNTPTTSMTPPACPFFLHNHTAHYTHVQPKLLNNQPHNLLKLQSNNKIPTPLYPNMTSR